jgi:hypothetical protein
MKLDPAVLSLIKGPVAISVAARDAAHWPSLCHAYGCRWEAKHDTLRIFLLADEARPVLADIAANGAVAAVFSDVRSFRSLQIKGRDGRAVAFDGKDARERADHYRRTSGELLALGYPAGPAQGYFSAPDGADFVTLAFTPQDVFQQTPGPGAGERLAGQPTADGGRPSAAAMGTRGVAAAIGR